MKKLLFTLSALFMLTVLIVGASFSASAETYSGECGAEGSNVTWSLDTETGELVISGTGDMNNYNFSGAPWYSYRKMIQSVVIENGITSIGDHSFVYCSLNNVTLSENITNIGENAFYNCTGFTNITLPNSLTSIESNAFYNCDELKDITLPKNLESIGNGAFSYCSKLETIYFNATAMEDLSQSAFGGTNTNDVGTKLVVDAAVTKIPAYLFSESSVAIVEFEAKSLCESIGNGAFSYCHKLVNLTLPENLTNIGSSAFSSCEMLTSIILPENLTIIGNYAFGNCTAIEKIYFNSTAMTDFSNNSHVFANAGTAGAGIEIIVGANVTKIPANLFHSCATHETSNIISIEFAKASICEAIGSQAFYHSNGPTSILLPESIDSIGNYVFAYNKTTIGFKSTELPTSLGMSWNSSSPYYLNVNCIVTIDDGTYVITNDEKGYFAKYVGTAETYEILSVINGIQITSIGNRAFYDSESLTNVIIPETVTDIEGYAFYGSSITSITLPQNLISIGEYAFYGCRSITSITLPKGITKIERNVFSSCSGLTDIVWPENLVSIGYEAFSLCGALTDVSLPQNLISIGSRAFYGCNELKSITLPENLTTVEFNSFDYCTALEIIYFNAIAMNDVSSGVFSSEPTAQVEKKLIIGSSVTKIPAYLFYGSGIVSIEFEDGSLCESIGSYAFNNCSALESLTLPQNLQSIGSYAFYNCSALESLTLPQNLQSIGKYAFANCTALEEIYFKATAMNDSYHEENIFSRAGKNGDGIEVIVGANVTRIPAYLFSVYHNNSELYSYSPKIISIEFSEDSQCETIGFAAFYSLGELKNITLPQKLTTIEYSAFVWGGIEKIVIPENVTEIQSGTFELCENLLCVYITSPTIAASITSGASCGYLTNYANTVAIQADITEIGSYIINNFTYVDMLELFTETDGGTMYRVYSTHSHAEDADIWSHESGTEHYTCTTCGLIKIVHEYGTLIPGKEPTCIAEGHIAHYKCSICSNLFNEDKVKVLDIAIDIAPDNHRCVLYYELPATCISNGEKEHYKCSYCNSLLAEDMKTIVNKEDLVIESNPNAHNYGNGLQVEIPATCISAGKKAHYYCSDCKGFFNTDEIKVEEEDLIIPIDNDAHSHNGNWTEAVPPTCTTNGTVGYYQCTLCYKHLDLNGHVLETIVIPTSGHDYGDLIASVAPTCESDGTLEHYKCSACSEYFDANKVKINTIVDPAKHKIMVETVSPNCSTGTWGYLKTYCSKCTNFKTTYTNQIAPEHDYTEWVKVVEESCINFGRNERSCNVCHKVEIQQIATTSHQYGKNGNTYTCSKCGDSYTVGENNTTTSSILLNQEPDFSFVITYTGADSTPQGHFWIIDAYDADAYYANETNLPCIPYQCVSNGGNNWVVKSENNYQRGNTYLVILPDDGTITFAFYPGKTLEFQIALDSDSYITDENAKDRIKFAEGVTLIPKGKVPQEPVYDEENSCVTISLPPEMCEEYGLELDDVICIADCDGLDELIIGGQNHQTLIESAIIGKIVSMYLDETGDPCYILKLTTPAANEVFGMLNGAVKVDVKLDEVELKSKQDAAAFLVEENLIGNETFAQYVLLMDQELQNYFYENGISLGTLEQKDILNVEVEFSQNDNGTITAKITITIKVPIENGSFKIKTTFNNKITLKLETYGDVNALKCYFDVKLVQTTTSEFSFEIEFEYKENASDETPFVKNNNTGMIHRRNCRYVSMIKETDDLKTLDGCDSKYYCSICRPEGYVSPDEHAKNMEKEIMSELEYTNWGEALEKVKTASENTALTSLVKQILKKTGTETSSPTVGVTIGQFTQYVSVFKLDATVKLVLNFEFNASLFLSHTRTIEQTYGIKNDKKGLDFYSDEIIENETTELRLLGRVEASAGIAVDANVGIFDLAEIGFDAEIGVYARLSGVLGAKTEYEQGEAEKSEDEESTESSTVVAKEELNEAFRSYDYAAAYFESGIYYSAEIYAKLFAFRVPLIKTGRQEKPLTQLGYDKVYYDFAHPDDNPEIEDDEYELIIENNAGEDFIDLGEYEIGLLYIDLAQKKSIGSGTEELPLKNDPNHYYISFYLESDYCEMSEQSSTLWLSDNTPETFKVKVTITIKGNDSWNDKKDIKKLFTGGASNEYTFTLVVKAHEWGDGPVKTVAPTCEKNGYELYVCRKCGCEKSVELESFGGHNYFKEIENHSATCTKQAYKIMGCTNANCSATKTTYEGDKRPHNYRWQLKGTLVQGQKIVIEYKCSYCGITNEKIEMAWGDYSELFEYEKRDDGTWQICGFDANKYKIDLESVFDFSTLIIPSYYNGIPVTNIRYLPAEDLSEVECIYLPETIREFNCAYCIGDFENLKEIQISSENPTLYGNGTCVINRETKTLLCGLENCIIPYTGIVEIIETCAFTNCNFEQIVIPSSVKRINSSAFTKCFNLKRIMLFNNLEIIEPDYVIDLTNGSELAPCAQFYMLDQVVFVGSQNDWNLRNLWISDNDYELIILSGCDHGYESFGKLTVTKYFDVKNSCEDYTRDYCYACGAGLPDQVLVYTHNYVKEEDVEASCTKIGKSNYYVCSKCSDEQYLAVPAHGHAMSDILTIPATATSIGQRYQKCWLCDDGFVLVDEIPQLPYSDGLIYQLNYDKTCYIVAGINDEYFEGDTIHIPPIYRGLPVETIYHDAFKGRLDITTVILPDSVKTIESSAFSYCEKLSTLDWGQVSVIGLNAFYNCTALTSIDLPDTVTIIGESAFYNCTALTAISLPDTITKIGNFAFGNTGYSSNSENWEVPNEYCKALYIGNYLLEFSSNDIITEYTVKDGTILIADKAFWSSKVETVCLPFGLKYIGFQAFYESELVQITLPSSIVELGKDVFRDCEELTTVIMEEGISNIPEYAFDGCVKLEQISISNSVSSIGAYAFRNCDSLKEIKLPSGLHLIDEYAFQSFTGLERITIPSTVSIIRYNSFFNCKNLWLVYIESETIAKKLTDGTTSCGYLIAYAKSIVFPSDITEIGTYVTENYCTVEEFISGAQSYVMYSNHSHVYSSIIVTQERVPCLEDAIYVRICGHCGFSREFIQTAHNLSEESNICADCEKTIIPYFSGASLTMEDNIAVNFKLRPEQLTKTNYSNPYVVFEFMGEKYIVKEYTIDSNGRYVFTFSDIAPRMMGEEIVAHLYAFYEGNIVLCQTRAYSVKEYCYNMLSKCDSGGIYQFNYTLKSLLVDLLNYGAAAQIYGDYHTDDLVNADLSEEQCGWATQTLPSLSTVQNLNYHAIQNPTTTWKAGGLLLEDSVTMRFKIATDSIEGVTVKITVGNSNSEWVINSNEFVATTDGYYIYFDGLTARQMRQTVYVTVYQGDTAVSNTITYSIESYAFAKQGISNTALKNLLDAMMKYGDSAARYANT